MWAYKWVRATTKKRRAANSFSSPMPSGIKLLIAKQKSKIKMYLTRIFTKIFHSLFRHNQYILLFFFLLCGCCSVACVVCIFLSLFSVYARWALVAMLPRLDVGADAADAADASSCYTSNAIYKKWTHIFFSLILYIFLLKKFSN